MTGPALAGPTALALAVLIGVSLGALGGGGSIVTLPILVYVAGIATQQAVPVSMVVVGGTSAVAAFLHARRGNVHPKATVLFAATGVAGAWLGSGLTRLVAPRTLMAIFAALMLAVGVAMLRDRAEEGKPARCRVWPCLGIGAGVGVLTGFLGVGGGFVIVPALVLFAGIETRIAIGTSLAVIALNAAGGLVGQLRYAAVDWALAGAFLGLALAGMGIGVGIAGRLPAATLRRAFAWGVIGLALAIGAATAAGVRLK